MLERVEMHRVLSDWFEPTRYPSGGDFFAIRTKHASQRPALHRPLLADKQQSRAIFNADLEIFFQRSSVRHCRIATKID